jgi:hypothetical protein
MDLEKVRTWLLQRIFYIARTIDLACMPSHSACRRILAVRRYWETCSDGAVYSLVFKIISPRLSMEPSG